MPTKILVLLATFVRFSSMISVRDELNELHRTKTRPASLGPPIVVSVSVFLNQLYSVDLSTMTIGVDLYLREEWEDFRIAGLTDNSMILPLESASAFWTPDTYFQNQIAGSHTVSNQGYIHVRRTGQIKSEKRMDVTARCHMEVQLFPFDTQACALVLESYAFSNEDVILRWIRKDINPPYEMAPTGFTILKTFTVDRTRHYTTGNYSELLACIVIRRNSGHYAILLFFPVSIAVLTAWVLSWNYTDSSFNELVLLLLAILGAHMLFRIRLAPSISYITLTDLYIFVSSFIVFICLFKVILWKYLARRVADGVAEGSKKSITGYSSTCSFSLVPCRKRTNRMRLSTESIGGRPYRVVHVISHLFLLIVLCVCFILLVLWPTFADDTHLTHNC